MALPLLVLVEAGIYTSLFPELVDWQSQVKSEGFFDPDIQTLAKGTSAERLGTLALMRRVIDEDEPSAVLLIGDLPLGETGWVNPDGHESRASQTDAHLMKAGFVGTDSVNFGSAGMRPNVPGDGRWDQNEISAIDRPISRIDFSNMPGSMENMPGYVYTSGCLAGKSYCPAVSEIAATKDYFRRNLAYRRGVWRPSEAFIVGGLWDTFAGQRAFTVQGMPQYAWQSGPHELAAGKDVNLLWNCAAISELGSFYKAPDCRGTMAFWVNTYRSYGMELGGCGTMRRWQQWALISTWGGAWWSFAPSDLTVAGAIRTTASRHTIGRWRMLYQVMGDLTLPLNVHASLLTRPANLRINSL